MYLLSNTGYVTENIQQDLKHLVFTSMVQIQWSHDFLNLSGKQKLVCKIKEFEKSGVKLQYSTEEREQLLVRVIRRLEKLRVQRIGIPL